MGVPLWRPRSPSPSCETGKKKARLESAGGRESRLGRRATTDDSERSRIEFLTGLRRRNALYRRDRASSRTMGARPQVHFTNPIADTMEPAPINMNEPYPYATGTSRIPMWMEVAGGNSAASTDSDTRNRPSFSRGDDAALSFRELLNSMRNRQRHRRIDEHDDNDGSSTTTDDESCIS